MLAESNRFGISLLLLRLIVGVAFVVHGVPKIAHPTSCMHSPHFQAPAFFQVMAALAEFIGGMMLIVGVATRLAAFMIACDMAVAILGVDVPAHAQFGQPNGESLELALVYLIGAIAFIVAGPGRWSVDAQIARAVRIRALLPISRSRNNVRAFGRS